MLISTNAMLALVGALGVFFLYIGLVYRVPEVEKTDLERVATLLDADKLSYQKGNFIKTVRRYGLDVALTQAELNVTRAVFIRDGFILMLAMAAVGYVIAGNLAVAIFLGIIGWFIYVMWLFDRRDKKRIEYEESLADMADRMASGAELTGTLQGMISHSCTLAPELLKGDFVEIDNQLTQGATFKEATEGVMTRRRSSMLNLLFDTLDMWSKQGTTTPLAEVLVPLTTTIRGRMRARQKMEAELSSPKSTLYIVACAPLAYILLLRALFPGASEAYATPLGMGLQIAALAISCTGYVLGNKILGSISKVLDIEEG